VPKTASPGQVKVPGTKQPFHASAVPDAFDARDLDYRPRLQPLPAALDVRPAAAANYYVMTQTGNSCTGHAVAAMINNVIAQLAAPGHAGAHVSPYMLYAMARRYDEFAGEADEGSSLRGALKGWYYHGVLPESSWPKLDPRLEPDIDAPAIAELAMREPLGAFYRVSAFRLDDMQSAVTELHAIAASAAVHEGWQSPTIVERKVPGSAKVARMAIIERKPRSRALGGHAFAIVGYNEIGFLVQNSWGKQWGRGGFATLPYDDWLASAYDAWVARPGVRSIVSQRTHSRTTTATAGEVAEGPGPDLARLDRHVVNLGNDGKLSTSGRFSSTPAQIDRIFARMKDYHDSWAQHPTGSTPAPRRIAIWAHGGLNSESTGLSIAWNQLNWWLNNRVYPITFAWQSGPSETLVDQLTDLTHKQMPAGGLGFDLVEQFDRLVERMARGSARWMWDQMKQNAQQASLPFAASKVTWPAPASGAAKEQMAGLPGASLTASRLKAYIDASPGPVEVHLLGHSAGSIFLGAMLDRLADVPIASLSYLAPAIRVDTFLSQVAPHLGKHVADFVTFAMDDQRELDDVCGAGGHDIYHKSLLYLVSRALERPTDGKSEVPLLGMQRFAETKVGGKTFDKVIRDAGGSLIWSPSQRPVNARSDSTSHGGFDDDVPTMTSVMLRVLGSTTPSDVTKFAKTARRLEPEPPDSAAPAGGTSANATVAALQGQGWV
jgi:hypothetical protein